MTKCGKVYSNYHPIPKRANYVLFLNSDQVIYFATESARNRFFDRLPSTEQRVAIMRQLIPIREGT